MLYLRLFLQSRLSVSPNCTEFATKREAEKQKQSTNDDFVLQLKFSVGYHHTSLAFSALISELFASHL